MREHDLYVCNRHIFQAWEEAMARARGKGGKGGATQRTCRKEKLETTDEARLFVCFKPIEVHGFELLGGDQ